MAPDKNFIQSGKLKTATIKSIPALKYFLEKGLALQIKPNWVFRNTLNKIGQQYLDLIEENRNQLKMALTDEDIFQLKNLRNMVPPNCTMLFLPGFDQPILTFNVDTMPFFDSGWLFHCTQEDNLKRVALTGFLDSPLDQIKEKKSYFSTKFLEDSYAHRLTHGISFAFQEAHHYQKYIARPDGSKIGGFFIFPFKHVLAANMILDTDTTDFYLSSPEIILRHKSYLTGSAKLISEMLRAIQASYPEWLKNYDRTKKFFEEVKKHITDLKKLPTEDFNILHMSENDQRRLANFAIENNFLYFSLLLNYNAVFILPFDDNIRPVMATFSSGQTPAELSGTIFQHINSYFHEEESIKRGSSIPGQMLVLALMKQHPEISLHGNIPDYISFMKKMTPEQIKKLFELTRAEILKVLDVLINRKFGTCRVKIKSGILFLNRAYSDFETLYLLANNGLTIFSNFPNDYVFFDHEKLDFFLNEVLLLKPLQIPRHHFQQKYYYFLGDNRIIGHNRETGQESYID